MNALSYRGDDYGLNLARAIWEGSIQTRYEKLSDQYGHVDLDSGIITLSDALLGNGRDKTAVLASVMAHEGTHVYGNRVEGIAQQEGLATYSRMSELFGLEPDESFVAGMNYALSLKESWSENTGSTDHWLIKQDGTIEDTEDRAFYREYIDASGQLRREKIAGSEYKGSRSLALYKFLGETMLGTMPGYCGEDLGRYDPGVVKGVLGWDDQALRLALKDGLSLDDIKPELQQKIKIQQLLSSQGYAYSQEQERWLGSAMKIPGLQENETLGIRLADGVWEKFTAGMTITRHPDAFSVYRDGVASKSYDVKDSADISFYKRNLDTGL
ncbi:MAG TPA: hypothetical protein PLC54_08325, partial [Spirochaetales bacterium]|nr:hypothetical protein [Spirochaetales bacterium]